MDERQPVDGGSFFLVYNPRRGRTLLHGDGRPPDSTSRSATPRGGESITASSPAANNVNLLVETVMLNYMALHGEQTTILLCEARTKRTYSC